MNDTKNKLYKERCVEIRGQIKASKYGFVLITATSEFQQYLTEQGLSVEHHNENFVKVSV